MFLRIHNKFKNLILFCISILLLSNSQNMVAMVEKFDTKNTQKRLESLIKEISYEKIIELLKIIDPKCASCKNKLFIDFDIANFPNTIKSLVLEYNSISDDDRDFLTKILSYFNNCKLIMSSIKNNAKLKELSKQDINLLKRFLNTRQEFCNKKSADQFIIDMFNAYKFNNNLVNRNEEIFEEYNSSQVFINRNYKIFNKYKFEKLKDYSRFAFNVDRALIPNMIADIIMIACCSITFLFQGGLERTAGLIGIEPFRLLLLGFAFAFIYNYPS